MSGSTSGRAAPDGSTGRAAPSWPRATGLSAGAVVAVILAAVGVLASRVDVALLAVPLVAAVGLSGSRRISPVETGSASLELGEPRGEEIGYTLTLLPPTGAEMAVVRYRVLDGEPREIVVCGRGASELVGRVPLLHSGPQELLRVDCRFLGVDAASVGAALDPIVASRVLAPRQDAVRSLPLPWRLQGLTGTHESARAGDGGDFRDVHPFRAGDRMRRIDWKATARRGQSAGDLYVRRTSALADATVLVVLDSRDDVGEQVAEWSRNTAAAKGVSSLDVAREAASSLASAYVHAGDRVGFQDLSSSARMVPHGGGERHLSRVLRAIEVTEPAAFPFRRERAPVVPPGALVFLLSSFLDDAPVRLALTWRGSGHRVVAVDVLPSARFARTDRFERIAHRLVLMEREERMEVLRARGVELLRWPEDGTSLPRHVRLLLLARPARRGRPAR